MSIKIAQEEIRRFLGSKKPEVLCITGKWGVGKTYSWTQYLLDARKDNRIALTRYAYVSLFGQNSLDDLKYALFESTIPLDQLETGPNFRSLEASLHFGEKWGRRLLQLGNVTTLGRAILNGAGRTLFLAVRDQLVCIDDLERHGKGLEVRDVLGMLSFLKEQRQCKVVLLLNDQELQEDAQMDFLTQLDKVVDTRIAFAPTPQEAAAIGVSANATFREALIGRCVTLGITNIRVIKKLEILCDRLREFLDDFDEGVLRQAIQTVTLFGWSHYEPKQAPGLDFVAAYNSTYEGYLQGNAKKGEDPDQEKAWSAILAAYGFSHADEFDLIILKGVQDGYFDGELLTTAGAALNKQIEFQKKDNSFQEAWDLYHGSFQSNVDEVLDKMATAFKSSVETISPLNLAGTISLFKDLGRTDQASELLAYYMDNRQETRKFYDLRSNPFGGDVRDPDVRDAFAAKLAEFVEKPDPGELLKQIATNSGWNPEDLETLTSLETKDYRRLFEASSGDELRGMVKAALNFGSFANASDQMKSIAGRATEALQEIGRQSLINARRIRIYGVSIDDPGPPQ